MATVVYVEMMVLGAMDVARCVGNRRQAYNKLM